MNNTIQHYPHPHFERFNGDVAASFGDLVVREEGFSDGDVVGFGLDADALSAAAAATADLGVVLAALDVGGTGLGEVFLGSISKGLL